MKIICLYDESSNVLRWSIITFLPDEVGSMYTVIVHFWEKIGKYISLVTDNPYCLAAFIIHLLVTLLHNDSLLLRVMFLNLIVDVFHRFDHFKAFSAKMAISAISVVLMGIRYMEHL